MSTASHESSAAGPTWCVRHLVNAADKAAMIALRAIAEPNKGRLQGTAARAPFDAIISGVIAPAGVTYEADTVGGVQGWWCRPGNVRRGEVILHLHGGWFNWGSAQAYRYQLGHLAARTGIEVFIPDYRLAPEHPFPAAPEDSRACYAGLLDQGYERVAITGDSAGGCLALGLLSSVTREAAKVAVPVGAVAVSPVTDLALTGASWKTRAAADPYFIWFQASALVHSYLGDHDPTDPSASPLYGDLTGLPPIRIHVGDDEVLLDDSLRYVERAVVGGVDAQVDVWDGMAHGFWAGIGTLAASTQALEAITAFLTDRLAPARGQTATGTTFPGLGSRD
jgi:monoterpene epsilon-lactone hydrolase